MKFKVGDKVKVINNEDVFVELGSLGFIKSFDKGLYAVKFKGKTQHLEENQLKLAKNKNKKRIKNLEKEVAELKLIVAKLREPSNLVKKELVRSNNELRAEVIEKAKNFVEDNIKSFRFYDFKIKEKTIYLISEKKYEKSKLTKSKCMKSDVFNEHIGKAIALGRALNLDVSEFENCVQPDIAVGQITSILTYGGKETGEVCEVTSINNQGLPKYIDGMHATYYKILNDTNAIYEVN